MSTFRARISRVLYWSTLMFALPVSGVEFDSETRGILKQYCLDCHSAAKHKGDLNLEQFSTAAEVGRHPRVWQGVLEQINLGEMPPKEKPQPTAPQKDRLVKWVNRVLEETAQSQAGDPGPVVLRRLSNAEYTYTIRDLTQVSSLDPVKEFPADSASGEGFMNVGNSLVMSPALLTKYLDAGKDIASHAVLLPDGIGFSPSTSQRDWTEERLAGIRSFYNRFTVNGGGTSVNLQGIRFDTKDGGVVDLEKYFAATIALRDGRKPNAEVIAKLARERGLNGKYLTALWTALSDSRPSLILDLLRGPWKTAKPDQARALALSAKEWQQSLWRFTTVGHIGKRDGPKAWQVPVTPLAEARELRLKLTPKAGADAVFYLTVADAGDGSANDFAVWENPRLVAPGRADLPLSAVQQVVDQLNQYRQSTLASAAKCLAAASELIGSADPAKVAAAAQKHGLELSVLTPWLQCLGIGSGPVLIQDHMTQRMESAQSYDFIKGWTGADALSVTANSSDQHVRVPGNMKPHSVAVHPSPQRRVLVGWQSPVSGAMRIEGAVQHAHPECGNGVTWSVEVRRANTRQVLASGVSQGGKSIGFGPFDGIGVQPGDVVTLVIGPRDGNHSCDLTAIDLKVADATQTWDLASEVSPNILAGNPHADSKGRPAVWHFYSEPDKTGAADVVLPPGSILARWRASSAPDERSALAGQLQQLLVSGPDALPKDAPDRILHRLLTSLNGPLLSGLLRQAAGSVVSKVDGAGASTRWGVDPALFGRHPSGGVFNPSNLYVKAPSLMEVRLPAELAEGCEVVVTASLHAETGAEGSVQMQLTTSKPASLGLSAGGVKEQGGKSTWSDGERPVLADTPILVRNGSQAKIRIEKGLDEFRQLFPAALCYTKIVPVDEVVTLTLYYREDDHLKRLMLDDAQAAELDRLWAELHYVSQSPLKLVDAFEQLWQFATQDADPSAFEPMRKPIMERAEAFRKGVAASQPAHVDGVLKFAEQAYRRPLLEKERQELRGLYQKLRSEDIAHEQAVRLTLARVLVAPAYLYRAEKAVDGAKPGPVTDWELATRLSYFLWSSAPDAELRSMAAAGKLRDPKVLAAQSRRMVRDPKVRRLATEFACAWLHVYAFDELGEKSERHFPTFTALRGSMYEETIRFFTDLYQRDGSVLDIINADHTFLNEELAKHYGIPGVEGSEWRRVEGLRQHGRGGILAQATTLAKQSGASRTSPILRGNWVAEALLGEKLPKPPKDVPRLPEDEAAETLTVRQLTEKHSSDPKCFVCHRRIDPYGYSLEGFDTIGAVRQKDMGGRPIDVKTVLMDGTSVDGLGGLRDYITGKRREAYVRQFSRKLLGYALGRGIVLSDSPLITEITQQLRSHDYRIGAAIETIVRSKQFRQIRGKEAPVED